MFLNLRCVAASITACHGGTSPALRGRCPSDRNEMEGGAAAAPAVGPGRTSSPDNRVGPAFPALPLQTTSVRRFFQHGDLEIRRGLCQISD